MWVKGKRRKTMKDTLPKLKKKKQCNKLSFIMFLQFNILPDD